METKTIWNVITKCWTKIYTCLPRSRTNHKKRYVNVVLREYIPLDVNILPGSFGFALKSTKDGSIILKETFFIGRHWDKLKQFLVHRSQKLKASSIPLLLVLASIFGFPVCTSDITQAYLQSAIPLSWEHFLETPVPELQLRPDKWIQILQPLYGLSESGNLWFNTLQNTTSTILIWIK